MKTRFIKNKNGVSLIALIVTVIVLLILAGVTIASVVGNNGLIHTAKSARNKSVNSNDREYLQTQVSEILMDYDEDTTDLSEKEFILEKLETNGYTVNKGNGTIKYKNITYNIDDLLGDL